MSKRKKAVLVVVEGPTEELALGAILEQLYEQEGSLHFEVVHGDLLSQWKFGVVPSGKASSSSMADSVKNEVLEYLKCTSPRITWNDLDRIVQITDTDSAFIPEDCAEPRLHDRNRLKRRNALELSRKGWLTYSKKQVPYALYYFSRDMEDALHGVYGSELNAVQKQKLARDFQQRFADDLNGFLPLLTELNPSTTYRESWDYILEGMNSNTRCSNLIHAFGSL